jgi:hypothetical protein
MDERVCLPTWRRAGWHGFRRGGVACAMQVNVFRAAPTGKWWMMACRVAPVSRVKSRRNRPPAGSAACAKGRALIHPG